MSNRLSTVSSARLDTLFEEATSGLDERDMYLKVHEWGPKSVFDISGGQALIKIKLGLDDLEFERHVAHELSHIIGANCGFTYKIGIITPGFAERQADGDLSDAEKRALDIRAQLGSYLSHVSAHEILAAAGYTDLDWDGWLLEGFRKG